MPCLFTFLLLLNLRERAAFRGSHWTAQLFVPAPVTSMDFDPCLPPQATILFWSNSTEYGKHTAKISGMTKHQHNRKTSSIFTPPQKGGVSSWAGSLFRNVSVPPLELVTKTWHGRAPGQGWLTAVGSWCTTGKLWLYFQAQRLLSKLAVSCVFLFCDCNSHCICGFHQTLWLFTVACPMNAQWFWNLSHP